jgi:hypothetical protein
VVRRRRERGYSLLEVTVMLGAFAAVLAIFFIATAEMRQWEKRLPINFMRHPQVSAVIARMRRDVVSAQAPDPYEPEFGGFTMSSKTLILRTIVPSGGLQTVVWDFSEPGVARRHAYTSTLKESVWTARGLPNDFSSEVKLDAVEFDDRPYGVRITAKDSNGRIAIDQILQPRAHD